MKRYKWITNVFEVTEKNPFYEESTKLKTKAIHFNVLLIQTMEASYLLWIMIAWVLYCL